MKKGEKRRENGLGKVEIGRFLFDVTILVLLLLGQFGVMQKEARAGMASDAGRAGTLAASYGDTERAGSITISYEDADGSPVVGAGFTIRRIGETVWDGSFRSLLPVSVDAETEAEALTEMAGALPALTITTDANGIGRSEGLREGLYLVEEETPAAEHFASTPFFVTIPMQKEDGWDYEVTAEPKPLAAGKLIVRKTVEGTAGEKERRFRFRISIGAEGEFPLAYSDGGTGTAFDGVEISLRHGQTATVSMLPAGCPYEVEELDADKDGYRTTCTGEKGNITAKETAEAAFVNTRGGTPTPTPPVDTPTPTPPGKPTPSLPPGHPPQTGDILRSGVFVELSSISVIAIGLVLLWNKRRRERIEETRRR